MQKLTVREAAENLGISQDAVRKRIQRGTLAHRKASDGHVYVYMDNHAGAQQETTVEEISATNQDNRSSWWDYAAGASALIVAASGLIYVLGLFTLWAPIAMTNADYLTAWQAASLVPKTVVAGLGVSQLVAFPLLTGIVIFGVVFSVQKWREGIRKETLLILSLYVPVIIYCTWHIATGPSPLSQVPVPQLVGFVVVVTGIMYSLLSTIFWLSVDGVARGGIWRAIVFLAGAVLAYIWWNYLVFYQESLGKPSVAIYSLTNVAIVVGAGIIVFWVTVMMARTRLVEIPPSESGPRKQLHPFLVVIFVSFVAAFMLAIPSKPPLPMVVIDIKDKDNNAVGRLLAHTDGYWYVFQERRYQPKSELTAIPDDEVKRAWVSKAQ